MKPPKLILPVIVSSQLFCTSLWFAGNAVMDELMTSFQLGQGALGHLTSAVQFGFITGTLIFAILCIADRNSPSKVFFVCAILGALFNLCIIWDGNTFFSILLFRFLTGFFLAGIYPVGMKIAADYFEKGLGKSLGFLVGALVIGTALPHLLKDAKGDFSWEIVMMITSGIALLGGLLMVLLVPDGPFRKPSSKFDIAAIPKIFSGKKFRTAAFGYFGHMWELYTFWAFVPVILQYYVEEQTDVSFNIPLLSFFIIAIGGLACVIGAYIAQRTSLRKVVFMALLFSGLCCLLAPVLFQISIPFVFISFLLFWGMVVIADSPLLSTMVAQNAPVELKGTALTIVNCLGFSITILSIQLINQLRYLVDSPVVLMLLAFGPMLGLMVMRRKGV